MVWPRLAVPLGASVFAPLRPDAGHAAWSIGVGLLPCSHHERKRQDLPGSWAILMCLCRALRPRQDRKHLALDGAPMLPPLCQRRRLPRVVLSRLNHTASALAVYASPRPSRDGTQDSLPAAGYALPGGIGYPQDCDERFPKTTASLLPPFPSLAWRNGTLHIQPNNK